MSTGRVGIVTIIDHDNYGNRLQNFALQECLRSRGWEVETIRNSPRPMPRHLLIPRLVAATQTAGVAAVLVRNGQRAASRIKDRGRGPRRVTTSAARRDAIARFTADRITTYPTPFEQIVALSLLDDRYDAVVVGSDQVWNPGFRHANEIDFLTFVPARKRIAYAASFGVHEIPPFLRRRYAEWLRGITHLSVREDRGALIVRELTGRVVPVVVDPTLLIEPEQWQRQALLPEVLAGRRYLATFFLGDLQPDESAALAEVAHSEDLEVVDLIDPTQPGLEAMSPLELLGAIRGAEIVATDSFHASVFSLVLERPSITKTRHKGDTRLATLFDLAGIPRVVGPTPTLQVTGRPDWLMVRKRLKLARDRSWQFLDGALGWAPRGGAA